MTQEEKMKEVLNDLFEESGITGEEIKNKIIDKLFKGKVIYDILPKIKCEVQDVENVERGVRGCLIFNGKCYFILPYDGGKAFFCAKDKKQAQDYFQKYENHEDIG